MAKKRDPHFFPLLARRAAYSLRRDGKTYTYSRYRVEIEEDCLFRCFYCDCHEKENGGKPNMRLDHFRPKGLAMFQHLKNEPKNLVYACHNCNQRKWDHWPAGNGDTTIVGREGFIDAFVSDRLNYFRVDRKGVVHAKKDPADYLIRLLELNRPLLKRLRERRLLIAETLPQLRRQAGELSKTHPEKAKLMMKLVVAMEREVL